MLDKPFHHLADLFPMLGAKDQAALAEDIRANGQREPVVMLDGLVLDGRNRWLACKSVGVEPRTRKYDGGDPLAFVLSANLHRRHLDTGQRAMIAAQIATMRQGERTDREPSLISGKVPPVSVADAAKMMDVGKSSVEHARIVLNQGTLEQIAAVKASKAKVSATAKALRATTPKTKRPAKPAKTKRPAKPETAAPTLPADLPAPPAAFVRAFLARIGLGSDVDAVQAFFGASSGEPPKLALAVAGAWELAQEFPGTDNPAVSLEGERGDRDQPDLRRKGDPRAPDRLGDGRADRAGRLASIGLARQAFGFFDSFNLVHREPPPGFRASPGPQGPAGRSRVGTGRSGPASPPG